MTEGLFGITFARPLWLLALLPCLALCWLLYQHGQRHTGWEAVLPATMRKWLLQQHPRGAHAGRYALLAGAWLLAIIALAGPVSESDIALSEPPPSNTVIVLDVSRNMLSNDLSPNRLERAKRKIRDIMQNHGDSQLSLIAFAGSAHLVTPLSHDRQTLANLLSALEPGIMPSDGRNVSQALDLARQMTDSLPRQNTRVLLISSGLEGEQLEALEQHASTLGSQLAILGIGTPSGSPVPLPEGGFMRDDQGRILLPRLDGQALAAIARRHGAGYHGISLNDSDLEHLLPNRIAVGSHTDQRQQSLVDQGHWLLLILLPLVALGARRGWLGVLLLASLIPLPAEAVSWQDLWQRADQQAMELLEREQPAAAAERFENPDWRAYAMYKASDHEAASQAYGELAREQPDNPDHHFNHGTALALAGHYNEALEAFEQALTRNPEHEPARQNRSHVEAFLEAQAKQQQEQQAEAETGDSSAEDAGSGEKPASSQPQASDNTTSDDNSDSTEAPSGNASPSTEGSNASTDSTVDSAGGEPDTGGNTVTANAYDEQQQAMQQWLQDIPDDPAELLRRKFLYQYLQQPDGTPR